MCLRLRLPPRPRLLPRLRFRLPLRRGARPPPAPGFPAPCRFATAPRRGADSERPRRWPRRLPISCYRRLVLLGPASGSGRGERCRWLMPFGELLREAQLQLRRIGRAPSGRRTPCERRASNVERQTLDEDSPCERKREARRTGTAPPRKPFCGGSLAQAAPEATPPTVTVAMTKAMTSSPRRRAFWRVVR